VIHDFAQPGVALPLGVGRYLAHVQPLLGVLAVAFAVSLIATPVMRKLALMSGIVDWPDAKRKAHAKPVAYLGGLAIFLGWLAGVGFFVVYLAPDIFRPIAGVDMVRFGFPMSIVIGAIAIVVTGLFDDIYGISARVKIGGQLFAAAAIAMENVGTHLTEATFKLVGLYEPLVAWAPWAPYWLGTFAIAGLIIGGCNAVNLIDGLDGLSSGVTGIAALGMLLLAAIFIADSDYADALQRGVVPVVLCLAILGGILGFLPYNFNPASIFMGDTGSLLLGYLCIATILMFGDTGNWSPMLFSAGIMCIALPITDTALAIVRRKLQGRPIFAPDAMHMHHMLRRSGLSVKQAVLVMYGIGGVFAGLGVTTVLLRLPWEVALGSLAVLILGIMLVGYRTARRLEADERTATAPLEAPAPGEDHGSKVEAAPGKTVSSVSG
jgi:UDP-GlcNAc:undecaprenyl-phosphate GlcNAc-1-phosphate transferase